MAVEVTTQISLNHLTVSDNPYFSGCFPPLRQYAVTLGTSGGQYCKKRTVNKSKIFYLLKILINLKYIYYFCICKIVIYD